MKSTLWLTVLCCVVLIPSYGQEPGAKEVFKNIVRSEKKHHQKIREYKKVPGLDYQYELTYQRLRWNVNPLKDSISGIITSYFHPAGDSLDTLVFDLAPNMTTDSVLYHGQKIKFEHFPIVQQLVITPPNKIAAGNTDSVKIYYRGKPGKSGFGSFNRSTHSNIPILWTLSEPFGARDWWPCKQTLNDKIDSVDIYVTIPDTFKVASNGILAGVYKHNGKATYYWKHRYPIATYLVAIAVTNYVEYTQYLQLDNNDSLKILNYVYPENLEREKSFLQFTLKSMKLFRDLFGEYPFVKEKYGHAQFEWGGGMEHQTMSFMVNFHPDLVAHELAHQWFGNKITCGSWKDIWLNEGFATYLTGLTHEFIHGESAWDTWKKYKINDITEQKGGAVYVSNPNSVSRIFDGRLSYAKGAYLLHMLRWILGDEPFFRGIRNYLQDPELIHGFARTRDLKRHLEFTGDQDLTWFFEDWFYGEGYPRYKINWRIIQKDHIKVTIDQQPAHPSVDFFEMKIPLSLKGDKKDSMIILDHEHSGQSFVIKPGFEVKDLIFDPDRWLLAKSEVNQISSPHPSLETMVFPNPFQEKFHIILSNTCKQLTQIDLFAPSGKKLKTLQNLNGLPTRNRIEFSLENFPPGLYFLKVSCKQNTQMIKLVKPGK